MLSVLLSGPSTTTPQHRTGSRLGLCSLVLLLTSLGTAAVQVDKRDVLQTINGSTYVWAIEDTYEGNTFFDTWDFFTGKDPTNGMVNYTTRDFAFSQGLAYVQSDGKVVMKADDFTELEQGVYRNSVRISSQKQYNTGLFILDINRAPWGCAVWPAWWTLGGNWPLQGEIDIIEGVHDNEHNQVTWHTGPNCTLTPTANFSGTVVQSNGQPNVICDGNAPGNAGCGITEWSRASYGPSFDAQGGGVFAMKWDDTGIAVWSFYRAAVPQDIIKGEPSPDSWGVPVAMLAPETCNPITNFVNHSIVFDITFCGDWAGNSYSTSGCPGSCAERLMDPQNFVNASWLINTLKVYKRVRLSRPSSDAIPGHTAHAWLSFAMPLVATIAAVLIM